MDRSDTFEALPPQCQLDLSPFTEQLPSRRLDGEHHHVGNVGVKR